VAWRPRKATRLVHGTRLDGLNSGTIQRQQGAVHGRPGFRRYRASVALPEPLREPLPAGARVRVRRDPEFGPGPWPAEPSGTVGSFGMVTTTRGPERTYWVLFDDPQLDPDGDGPYESSQVLERYLEPITP